MGIRIMNLVWPLRIEPTAKFVLLALADRADDTTGSGWPSVDWIMGRTCASRRTVQRALKDLHRAGHISWDDRPGTSRIYTLHPCQSDTPAEHTDPRHSDAPPRQSDAPGGANMTRGGANVTREGCQPDAQSLLIHSEIPSVDPTMNLPACASEAAPSFTVEGIASAWNKVAEAFELPSVRGITGRREKAVRALMKVHGEDDWTEAFRAIGASDFLQGKRGGWQVTFDWLIAPGNFLKTIEGNYDNGPDPRADGVAKVAARALGLEPNRREARLQRQARRSDADPYAIAAAERVAERNASRAARTFEDVDNDIPF